MTKEEKLAAIDSVLAVFRRDVQESQSREADWGRDKDYYNRMSDLLKTTTEHAVQELDWLNTIRAEVESGKL